MTVLTTVLTLVLCIALPLALIPALADARAPQGPPRPGPEHAQLAAQAGTWDAEVELMGEKSRGLETSTMRCGGFWLITDFKGEAFGGPFEGHGAMGFDPAKQKFIGTWVDSMGGGLTMMEGTASADGKVLTCYSEGPDPTGKVVRSKHVTTIVNQNQRTYAISSPGADGKEAVTLRITYTRKRG